MSIQDIVGAARGVIVDQNSQIEALTAQLSALTAQRDLNQAAADALDALPEEHKAALNAAISVPAAPVTPATEDVPQ
jgi:2-phospho-L-lactate guanylyltransferase (CobY/MobA/RfbA family)